MGKFFSISPESVGSASGPFPGRAKANDQDAWQRLVTLYSPLVLFWCRRAGIPFDGRDNVFHDVFCAVARHAGDFQGDGTGSFRAWLRFIVRRKAADHFARRGQAPRVHSFQALMPNRSSVGLSRLVSDAGRSGVHLHYWL